MKKAAQKRWPSAHSAHPVTAQVLQGPQISALAQRCNHTAAHRRHFIWTDIRPSFVLFVLLTPLSLLPWFLILFSFRYFGLGLLGLVWFHEMAYRFVAWTWLKFLGSSNPPASALRDWKYKDTILCQSYFLPLLLSFLSVMDPEGIIHLFRRNSLFLLFFVCYFIIQGYIRLFSCKYIIYVENSHPNTFSQYPFHSTPSPELVPFFPQTTSSSASSPFSF